MVLAEQSLGGEDFSWMLEKVPGAMMRLGTRTPGGRSYDLHQGDFTVDERLHRRSVPGYWPRSPCVTCIRRSCVADMTGHAPRHRHPLERRNAAHRFLVWPLPVRLQ